MWRDARRCGGDMARCAEMCHLDLAIRKDDFERAVAKSYLLETVGEVALDLAVIQVTQVPPVRTGGGWGSVGDCRGWREVAGGGGWRWEVAMEITHLALREMIELCAVGLGDMRGAGVGIVVDDPTVDAGLLDVAVRKDDRLHAVWEHLFPRACHVAIAAGG